MNKHNLAVLFRTMNPAIRHASTWDAIEATRDFGLAVAYGRLAEIPRHHHRKRRTLCEAIADKLDSMP